MDFVHGTVDRVHEIDAWTRATQTVDLRMEGGDFMKRRGISLSNLSRGLEIERSRRGAHPRWQQRQEHEWRGWSSPEGSLAAAMVAGAAGEGVDGGL